MSDLAWYCERCHRPFVCYELAGTICTKCVEAASTAAAARRERVRAVILKRLGYANGPGGATSRAWLDGVVDELLAAADNEAPA
jgi:hypothetical protein